MKSSVFDKIELTEEIFIVGDAQKWPGLLSILNPLKDKGICVVSPSSYQSDSLNQLTSDIKTKQQAAKF